jgi:hypothetical protein
MSQYGFSVKYILDGKMKKNVPHLSDEKRVMVLAFICGPKDHALRNCI